MNLYGSWLACRGNKISFRKKDWLVIISWREKDNLYRIPNRQDGHSILYNTLVFSQLFIQIKFTLYCDCIEKVFPLLGFPLVKAKIPWWMYEDSTHRHVTPPILQKSNAVPPSWFFFFFFLFECFPILNIITNLWKNAVKKNRLKPCYVTSETRNMLLVLIFMDKNSLSNEPVSPYPTANPLIQHG